MTARPVNAEELELLVHGGHGHPHALLGPHVHEGEVTVRIFKPLAKSVKVVYQATKGARPSSSTTSTAASGSARCR